MKSCAQIVWLLLSIGGCHHEPNRVFELAPVDRDHAFAMWAQSGGSNARVGRLEKSGDQDWSASFNPDDTALVSIAANAHTAWVAFHTSSGWQMDAFSVAAGEPMWTKPLPQKSASRLILRPVDDSVVVMDEDTLTVFAANGEIKASVDIHAKRRSPTVTSSYVVFEERNSLESISIATGHVSKLENSDVGCANGDEYVQWTRGNILVRSLEDLSKAAVVARPNPEIGFSVVDCGHFGTKRVLTAHTIRLTPDPQQGTAVLITSGETLSVIEFPHDLAVVGEASQWRGKERLNGALTRFVPYAIRNENAKSIDVLTIDLEKATFAPLKIDLQSDDVSMFRLGERWMVAQVGATPVLTSMNGSTGETTSGRISASKLPAVEPSDVAAATLWVDSGKWVKGKFELFRYDQDLKLLK